MCFQVCKSSVSPMFFQVGLATYHVIIRWKTQINCCFSFEFRCQAFRILLVASSVSPASPLRSLSLCLSISLQNAQSFQVVSHTARSIQLNKFYEKTVAPEGQKKQEILIFTCEMLANHPRKKTRRPKSFCGKVP